MMVQAEGIARDFFRSGKGTNIFTAVYETDFILEEGKITELIGRSGSGKTTFAQMLAGLLTPTRGRVLINGQDFYTLEDGARSLFRNRHIGIVPQGRTALSKMTVLENILLPAAMYGETEGKEEKAEGLLERMGIADLREVYANELSGGELKRMSIARALINEPEILVADEPTGDLDDETTEAVLSLLRDYAGRGKAVLMVSHDREAVRYADRLYRMEKGILREEETQ